MTTLPQTSSLRLPRAAGSGHMAIPALAGAAPQAPRMTGADVWRVIRGSLWLIITMVVVMTGLGYVTNMYLADHFPRYTATGFIQVQPYISVDPLHPVVPLIDPQATALEQRTQARLMGSDSLFSSVLSKADGKIRETEWFKEMAGSDGRDVENAKKDLRDNLSVIPVTDTKLIIVSMTYRIPKDARTVVDEIVSEHLTQQQQTTRDKQRQRSQTLNRMRDELGAHLKDISSELHNTAIKLNMDGIGAPGRLSAKELELSELIRRQLELQSVAVSSQAQYKAMADMIQRGESSPKVEDYVSHDPTIAYYRQQLDILEMDIQQGVDTLGADNQRVLSVKKRRDLIDRKMQDKEAEMRNTASTMLLNELSQSSQQSQQALSDVSKRIEAIKEDLGADNNLMNQFLARKDEERALLKQQQDVDEELGKIVQQQNGADAAAVSWMTRPDVPGTMSFPKLVYTLTAAIFLGLVISLGIAFLREALDTTVRSPRDVARVGQLNLLGMVPDEQDDPQAAGSRLPLVIFDAPNSAMAEQFRQVRTRLQQAASLDTTRSLMITSPSPGDGKTSVACNLAAGLALNGRKILLVDANFRRPDIHKIFGITNDVGLSDVLASVDRFTEACSETQIPNLSVMATGAKPANPTELLESQLLTDFIERALQDFDHVIFDSGPLLFVSDSVALAPRVDGVVVVVRARTNSRGLLQRMRDTLRQIKAENLGVVLNAVRAQGGGYYGRNIKTYYAYQNGGNGA